MIRQPPRLDAYSAGVQITAGSRPLALAFWGAGVTGVALLPWIGALAAEGLWAWVALDLLEATALIATAVTGLRRSASAWRWAAAASALLVVDAAVDTGTASDPVRATWMAVLEIGGAAACAALAAWTRRGASGCAGAVRTGV